MTAISPDELLRLWASERIPAEHAIGQLVQLTAQLQNTLETQRRTLAQVQAELARIQAAPPSMPSKRAPAKR